MIFRRVNVQSIDVHAELQRIREQEESACLHTFNEKRDSTGISLIYKGRLIGGMYNIGDVFLEEVPPITHQCVLRDLIAKETRLALLSLPSNYVVPLASIFRPGVPFMETSDLPVNVATISFVEQLKKTKSSGLGLVSTPETYVFINAGEYRGSILEWEGNIQYHDDLSYLNPPTFLPRGWSSTYFAGYCMPVEINKVGWTLES